MESSRSIVKKWGEDHPDIIAIRRYDKEIESLEEKYDAANTAHDWSSRNFIYNQLVAKRTNRSILIGKLKRAGVTFE